MSWRWISIAAMLGALVLGYGALTSRHPLDTNGTTALARPDYFLNDAVISQTQEDGSPSLRLTARRVEQDPSSGAISLHQVRADYQQSEHQWVLTAERGYVPPDSRLLQLHGEVELRPSDRAEQSFLHTDALEIDTLKNLAYSTASPVRARVRDSEVTARGLRADLNTEIIELEGVRGRLTPQ